MLDKAIFLDRDGVINHPVFNPKTNEYEAPHKEEDLKLFPGVIESLKELLNLKYKLFLVSNQPDYAKGKTSLQNLLQVHNKLHSILTINNILFTEYYYCYHHPKGIVPEYTMACACRKPGNLSLKQACTKYNIDLSHSWMVGDSDVDIFCGQSVEIRTIMISLKESTHRVGQSTPEFKVNSLQEAVKIIKKESQYAKH